MLTNNKASIEWNMTTISGIILAALVGITILNIIGAYLHPDSLQSTLLAKDVALELEAVHATPYNIIYQHPASLPMRSIVLDGNSIQVIARNDGSISKKKIGQLTTFNKYYFYTSDDLVLPSKAIIDASTIIIAKQGAAATITDGSIPLQNAVSQTTSITDVRIAVVPILLGTGNDNILEGIAQSLKDYLKAARLQTVTPQQATIIIQIGFQEETDNSIYYSTLNKETVRLLAVNTKTALATFLQPTFGGEQQYTNSVATLEILLGTKQQDFTALKDKNRQRLIASAITSSIEKTYPKAQHTITP